MKYSIEATEGSSGLIPNENLDYSIRRDRIVIYKDGEKVLDKEFIKDPTKTYSISTDNDTVDIIPDDVEECNVGTMLPQGMGPAHTKNINAAGVAKEVDLAMNPSALYPSSPDIMNLEKALLKSELNKMIENLKYEKANGLISKEEIEERYNAIKESVNEYLNHDSKIENITESSNIDKELEDAKKKISTTPYDKDIDDLLLSDRDFYKDLRNKNLISLGVNVAGTATAATLIPKLKKVLSDTKDEIDKEKSKDEPDADKIKKLKKKSTKIKLLMASLEVTGAASLANACANAKSAHHGNNAVNRLDKQIKRRGSNVKESADELLNHDSKIENITESSNIDSNSIETPYDRAVKDYNKQMFVYIESILDSDKHDEEVSVIFGCPKELLDTIRTSIKLENVLEKLLLDKNETINEASSSKSYDIISIKKDIIANEMEKRKLMRESTLEARNFAQAFEDSLMIKEADIDDDEKESELESLKEEYYTFARDNDTPENRKHKEYLRQRIKQLENKLNKDE